MIVTKLNVLKHLHQHLPLICLDTTSRMPKRLKTLQSVPFLSFKTPKSIFSKRRWTTRLKCKSVRLSLTVLESIRLRPQTLQRPPPLIPCSKQHLHGNKPSVTIQQQVASSRRKHHLLRMGLENERDLSTTNKTLKVILMIWRKKISRRGCL